MIKALYIDMRKTNSHSDFGCVTISLKRLEFINALSVSDVYSNYFVVFLVIQEQMCEFSLIPAIKGGREKHGKSLQQLSVSWAEDVYDPPPSIVSRIMRRKKSNNRSKRGQKGSSSTFADLFLSLVAIFFICHILQSFVSSLGSIINQIID